MFLIHNEIALNVYFLLNKKQLKYLFFSIKLKIIY